MTSGIDRTLSRRNFLVAAASTSVAPFVLGATSTPSPMGLGSIGCGRRGHAHLAEIQSLGFADVKCVACYDPDERAVATFAASGARVMRTWREVVDHPEVAGFIVAAPDGYHAEMVHAAIERGKPVLVEAPVMLNAYCGGRWRGDEEHPPGPLRRGRSKATRSEELEQLENRTGLETLSGVAVTADFGSEASGRVGDLRLAKTPKEAAVCVVCRSPFQNDWSVAARWVRDGAIGRVWRIQSRLTWRHMVGSTDAVGPEPRSWRWNASLGLGPAAELLHHQLYPLLAEGIVSGLDVQSLTGGSFSGHGDQPDGLMLTGSGTDGERVVLTADPLPHPSYVSIRGEKGLLEFKGSSIFLTRYPHAEIEIPVVTQPGFVEEFCRERGNPAVVQATSRAAFETSATILSAMSILAV